MADDEDPMQIRIACCWICGQMRNDRCRGLYHELVDILSNIYPPLQKRDEVDTFKRLKVWPFVCGYRSLTKWECRCGSLALAGPIVDGKGTVWNPDWKGARVSFVQSYLVQKADQERMKADMLDQLSANLEVEQAQLNVNLEKMQRRAKPSNIVRLTLAQRALPTIAEDTEGTDEYSETTEDEYSKTTEDAETAEERAQRLLDYLLRESV